MIAAGHTTSVVKCSPLSPRSAGGQVVPVHHRERAREREAVERRYSDVRAWPFPAAVVFAISERDAAQGLSVR